MSDNEQELVSEQRLLNELVLTRDELGHSPDAEWWRANRSSPTYAELIERFGSWPRALAAAGLPTVTTWAPETHRAPEPDPAADADPSLHRPDATELCAVDPSMEIWSLPIARLPIHARGIQALQRAGLVTVGQLAKVEAEQLRTLGPVGESGLIDIHGALAQQGLRLPPDQLNGTEQMSTPARAAAIGERRSGTPEEDVPPEEFDHLVAAAGRERVDRAQVQLEELNLTVRTFNALRRAGYRTLGDVAARHESELAAIPNFGQKCMDEITTVLATIRAAGGLTKGAALGRRDGLGDAAGSLSHVPLDEARLSVRTSNALRRAGFVTLGDVAARHPSELEAVPNLGRKSVAEILSVLRASAMSTSPARGSEPSDPETRPNGPKQTVPDTRAAAMIASFTVGATLQEIADEHGVTRERVRQILKRHGLSGRAGVEARRVRAREMLLAHRDEIMRDYRRGVADGETARRLGLPASGVADLIRELGTPQDRTMRRSNARRTAEQVFSDADIIDAILEIARRYGRTPTTGEYARAAQHEGLPSIATVHNRLTWRGALEAAGLQPPTAKRDYKKQWTAEACWRVLREFVVELGDVPSFNRYDDLAQMDASLPSGATVRNRLGGWQAVTAQLARLPRAADVLNRLQVEIGDREPIDSEAIWMAYLSEVLNEVELVVLLITGDFVWDADFGDPPELLQEHLPGAQ